MDFTLDASGTDQQKNWVADAIKQCAYTLDNISAAVTVQWVHTMPGNADTTHPYMITVPAPDGSCVISIIDWADDPHAPGNQGLPDPAGNIQGFYAESFVHELGHVVVDNTFNLGGLDTDPRVAQVCALYWHAALSAKDGKRYGTADDWDAEHLSWGDEIREGVAEFFKRAFYQGQLIFQNRSNWNIDQPNWATMFNFLQGAAGDLFGLTGNNLTADFYEDFSDPERLYEYYFTNSGWDDPEGFGAEILDGVLYLPPASVGFYDAADFISMNAYGYAPGAWASIKVVGTDGIVATVTRDGDDAPSGALFALTVGFQGGTGEAAWSSNLGGTPGGTVGLCGASLIYAAGGEFSLVGDVPQPDNLDTLEYTVEPGAGQMFLAIVGGTEMFANDEGAVQLIDFGGAFEFIDGVLPYPFWLVARTSEENMTAELWTTDPALKGKPVASVGVAAHVQSMTVTEVELQGVNGVGGEVSTIYGQVGAGGPEGTGDVIFNEPRIPAVAPILDDWRYESNADVTSHLGLGSPLRGAVTSSSPPAGRVSLHQAAVRTQAQIAADAIAARKANPKYKLTAFQQRAVQWQQRQDGLAKIRNNETPTDPEKAAIRALAQSPTAAGSQTGAGLYGSLVEHA
jgi:hypothetical protein